VGDVAMPTPVALAGDAICILGGYLLGVVVGAGMPARTSAVVESYDPANGRLCLSGETLSDQEGVTEDGRLCGTWRRSEGGTRLPEPGDEFRFVSMLIGGPTDDGSGADDDRRHRTVIYGDVVP
jgi:hypothetical protein